MNALLVSLATTVAGSVLLRYITLGRARITSDTEKSARDALTRAARVFGALSATGGRLAHPWREGAQEFDCHGLESDLTSAHDRIKNQKLRASLRTVRSEIHGVWAAAYVGRAAVGFPGHQATPGEIAHQRDTERKVELQRRHAEQGTAATKEALAKLGRLAARAWDQLETRRFSIRNACHRALKPASTLGFRLRCIPLQQHRTEVSAMSAHE